MNRLWITGAAGIVGGCMLRQAQASGRYDHICAFTHTLPAGNLQEDASITWLPLDIGDRSAIQEYARQFPPSLIFNPAAMTQVDACETNQQSAIRANTNGPRYLAEAARGAQAPLYHISTDYIFPGDDAYPGPYAEDAEPRAVSVYGQTKLDGERAITEICADTTPFAIVRTALVVGTGKRPNFINWIIQELTAGRPIRIVNDQFNTPTLADDVAAAVMWLAQQHKTGVYHIAGPDFLGRHEWAQQIIQRYQLDGSLITYVSTSELRQPAQRPKRGGLLTARYNSEHTAHAPSVRGVAQALREISWTPLAP